MKHISAKRRKDTEAAIREVFEASCAAWNRGDLDAYLSGYWDSEQTLWISSGALTRGKKAIVDAHKARFSSGHQMGKLTLEELTIDVLTDTDALAFGRWRLAFDNNAADGFFTVQLRKIEGNWLMVCDHSSTRV